MLDDHDARRDVATPPVSDRRWPARSRAAYVAAFVCPELERLGREVGFPLAVIAATSDPERHAARLSATWHAGWSPRGCDEWFMPFDFGFVSWEEVTYRQLQFDERWLGRVPLPDDISISSGSFVVDLPPGASAGDLSAILRAGLAGNSYDHVARRPDRVRQRYATNRPVVVAPRYALAAPGDIEKLVAVDDLFAFRPGDLPSLAQAVAHARNALTVGIAMTCSGWERDGIEESSGV